MAGGASGIYESFYFSSVLVIDLWLIMYRRNVSQNVVFYWLASRNYVSFGNGS